LNKFIFTLLFTLFFAFPAFGKIPVCDEKNYKFIEHLYRPVFDAKGINQTGKKSISRPLEEIWDEYTDIYNYSVKTTKKFDEFHFLVYSEKKPDNKPLFDKKFKLKKKDKGEIFAEDFNFSKMAPERKKRPALLHIILLSAGKPVCLRSQKLVYYEGDD
jgi:hypothetical protein